MKKVEMYSIKTCDICAVHKARFDGKTIHGPWAFMCNTCFKAYGLGLGLGKGQELVYVIEEANAY